MHTTDRRLNFIGFRPHGDLAGLTCYTSKRNKVVWFVKAPPTCPPSVGQRLQRIRFVAAAKAWQSLPKGTRNAWNSACKIAGLHLHGYDLWIHWQLVRHVPTIRTIERQTNLQLL